MPTVETSVWVQASLDRVYAVAQDSERFPEYMSDVKSLTVLEREGSRVVSDWVGLIPQFMIKVRWRQEDQWDDEAHSCVFKQVQGDYDMMEGRWDFLEENGGTRFNSVVNYEYEIPTLGPLVRKVIYGVVVKNMDSMLNAIKQRAETAT